LSPHRGVCPGKSTHSRVRTVKVLSAPTPAFGVASEADMEVIYPRCAGLDVHKKTVVACRVHTSSDGRKQQESETFGTTTRELLRLRDWLAEWECTHVALESTGDYWKPVYNLLEGCATLLLVNARHVKAVPGRKTDVRDAEWLADLLRHGLLKASFVPERPQRELRDLTRGRAILAGERAAVVNRLQKSLEGANIKLSSVASDVVGRSARAMLAALVAGTATPAAMAELAQGKLRDKREALAAALEGQVQAHHRFLIVQHLAHLDFLEEQVEAYDAQIEREIEALSPSLAPEDPPDGGDSGGPATTGNAPESPAPAASEAPRVLTLAAAVERLDPIPGIARRAAQAILAEIGTDMGRFPSEGHLTNWAGVAPGNHESAGKRYSGKTTGGNPALRKALMQAAHGAIHTKGSFFGELYGRLAARRGKKRAIVAVARRLLIVIYHVLSDGRPYKDLGADYYAKRRGEDRVQYHLRQLEKLGKKVTLSLEPALAA
jgi:transposase